MSMNVRHPTLTYVKWIVYRIKFISMKIGNQHMHGIHLNFGPVF
jgi:hypothetical protein